MGLRKLEMAVKKQKINIGNLRLVKVRNVLALQLLSWMTRDKNLPNKSGV